VVGIGLPAGLLVAYTAQVEMNTVNRVIPRIPDCAEDNGIIFGMFCRF